MKLLVLGSDPSILNPDSSMAQRTREYGSMVEKYTVIVANNQDKKIKLNDKIEIYGLHARFKFLLFFKIYFFAGKIINSEKYDLISSPDAYYLGLISWFLAKHFSLPLQVQVHGWEKNNLIRKMLAKYVLKRANNIRVVSQRLKKQLENDFKINSNKIINIPIYVDISEKSPSTKILERNNQKTIFLTVSRLVKVKNISLQIKAFKAIISQYPNSELWIVGDGPEAGKLKKITNNLGLKESIKFWGRQENVGEFYRKADIFLLTSESEGWGMVVIEASSYGLPIIMTDVGCAGEVIVNNKNGIIIPINQFEPLVSAMERLISNYNLRGELGNQAKLAISNLPNLKQTLTFYYEGWMKMLNNQKKP